MGARILLLIITCFWVLVAQASESLTLQVAIEKAYASNPNIAAAEANADAEQGAIRSQSFLEDPHLGYMHENNMNFMEQQQGPMNSLFVSQQIKFPAKYFLLGRAQSARMTAAQEMAKQKKLEIRSKVVSGYYGLFVTERVLALLQVQRESLREIASTAETRYATGSVPQQDEMKAHVEQTMLEKDILMVEEERTTTTANLAAAIGANNLDGPELSKELHAPKVMANLSDLSKTLEHRSKRIKEAQARVDESDALKSLAHLSYAPDFNLSYRRAVGTYFNQNAYSAAVEITFPLWFFAKQTGEVSAASAHADQAVRELEATRVDHVSEVKSLIAKVQSTGKLLEIYETGLIPQATSTLNSSRGSYRAGRSGFIELLDSERSLYNMQIAYYRTLAQFAENVAKLEETLGESISSLPFGDRL